jgi:hypothetical protein
MPDIIFFEPENPELMFKHCLKKVLSTNLINHTLWASREEDICNNFGGHSDSHCFVGGAFCH